MNHRRERIKKARRMAKKGRGKWIEIDLSVATAVPPKCTRAYHNNLYMVTVYDNAPTTKGDAIQVMVQPHNMLPIKHHWREMQRIKNELFGKEVFAVEYYPAQSKLIDDHNIYHFWIFPEGVLPTWKF